MTRRRDGHPSGGLLSDAIRASGYSVREFGRRILKTRNTRNLFRMLAEEEPVPPAYLEKCRAVLVAFADKPPPLPRTPPNA